MPVGNMSAWMMGAYGSAVGGAVVAWYLGDKKTKEKIIFLTPFLFIGILGVYKVFGEE